MTPPPYPHERFNTVPDASDGLLRNGRRLSDEVFDFGLGDEAYKARFASETRQVFNIHLFGSGMTPRLKRAALSLRETAKRNPRFYGAVKKVLNRG
jgi:CelD/BcsL family acetyltransferase involved in cellulose biosynthesis